MPTISPFTPHTNGTVTATASTSATLTQLSAGGGTQCRIWNSASVAVYVEFGASTVTASAGGGSMPVPSLSWPPTMVTLPVTGPFSSTPTTYGAMFVSAIASVATTTPIFFTRGEGFGGT